ncbi:NAD-dependent epimerase/dehydratase family protein [Sneathiella marina]|uniref:NAD-dependent epimerase/dehydratase family protein n=1 Tax=Sneathiella marina TaxID=2950108 RepID=A0ABY4W756_9PROT|nr:NAD-dependent epimerase/dehydratase family protein [Sneathiella marina]USG62857.1 NAD-dependent epimerase/dehydratase family protein [Sneathiella marina]
MTVLVTGAAGFIGMHVSMALLDAGEHVVGIDNLSAYYDVQLKQARLDELRKYEAFSFLKLDLSEGESIVPALAEIPNITKVVHLAAQAGVRYSLEHPFDYTQTNVTGFLAILEYCRQLDKLEHLVFASSSSVYGGNTELPYSVDQSVDKPVSLYAATKKANELMAHSYAHLYGIPLTGLRFFTVYGPWGRPDMAYWTFTEKMLQGEPLPIFNRGEMKRDFTYIDDIANGVLAVLAAPPVNNSEAAPYRIYNIGNHRSEPLLNLVSTLEASLKVKANLKMMPMQSGDVKETFADIDPIRRDVGYEPATSLQEGIPKFVEWYKSYKKG